MSQHRRYEESREERWLRKLEKYKSKLLRTNDYGEEYYDTPYGENQERVDDGDYYYDPMPHSNELPTGPSGANANLPTEPVVSPEPTPSKPPPVQDPVAGPSDSSNTASVSNTTDELSAFTSDGTTVATPDPELLKALGMLEDETVEWGEPIFDEIALRLKPLLLKGFKKEDRDLILKKYPFPKNVPLAKAPTLNAEIGAMLTEQSRNRDKRVCAKQNQLGIALGAITKAMSLLLSKNAKQTDILSILSDASKLIADSHYAETETRRSLITPLVDKGFVDSLKDRQRDEFLFGEKLGEMVQNSRGIKRAAGQLIQASTSTSNLNSRGPPSRGRIHHWRRGAGQQRPYAYRRRPAPYAPPPAAPPARRQPPPQAQRRPPPASVVPRVAPPVTSQTMQH